MKVFSTVFTSLLILLSGLFLTSCNSGPNGDTLEEAKRKGYANLKVLYIPSEGFAYQDDNNQLTGVTIDIMDEFADFVNYSHGIEMRYEFVPYEDFSTFYNTVKESSGGVFGLGNVTITEDRQNELRFSPPYMTNIAVLISHYSVDELTSLEVISQDFDHMTALAFQGTLHETRIEMLRDTYWHEMPIEYAHSNSAILIRVAENSNYFAYIDIYNYWRAAERGMPVRQHSAGDFASERFGVIMPLNSDWDKLITDFFERGQGFRTSTTYRQILERHLGEELTEKLERARLSTEDGY